MSFNDVLDNLKTALEGNAALLSFCNTEFGKAHTVKRVFKRRTEVSADELPIIMITRPDTIKSFRVGVRDSNNTVRLYFGFLQQDRDKAQENIIESEELIDAVLVGIEPGAIGAKNITPTQSANDEGMFHPFYFIVMDAVIQHRRFL